MIGARPGREPVQKYPTGPTASSASTQHYWKYDRRLYPVPYSSAAFGRVWPGVWDSGTSGCSLWTLWTLYSRYDTSYGDTCTSTPWTFVFDPVRLHTLLSNYRHPNQDHFPRVPRVHDPFS